MDIFKKLHDLQTTTSNFVPNPKAIYQILKSFREILPYLCGR